jgi:hypothetical protein
MPTMERNVLTAKALDAAPVAASFFAYFWRDYHPTP